jgi:hypothetical protein
MPYEVEDEVDWSDSPLGPPSPKRPQPLVVPSRVDSVQDDEQHAESLFVSETATPYTLPTGTPLHFSTHVNFALHESLTNPAQLLISVLANIPFLLVHSGPESVFI